MHRAPGSKGASSPSLSQLLSSGGLTPARLLSALLIAVSLALGVWLLVLAAAQRGAPCEVALAGYATLDGAFFIVAGGIGALAALVFLRSDGDSRGAWPLAAGLTSVCCLAALLIAWMGVKLYGTGAWRRALRRTRAHARLERYSARTSAHAISRFTQTPPPPPSSPLPVLLFGNSLWSRQTAAVAGLEPCAPALYQPLAIFTIICWTLPILLICLALLGVLAWSLWEAYVFATRRAKRAAEEGGDEGEAAAAAEPNPWLTFEGMPAAWELREEDEADK